MVSIDEQVAAVPPLRHVHHLVEVLDCYLSRRPAAAPPVLLFTGADASSLVDGLAERMAVGGGTSGDARGPLLPHVLVGGVPGADPGAPAGRGAPAGGEAPAGAALLDDIAGGLQQTMPRGAGRLRLPVYWTCRDVLDATIGRAEFGVQKRRMRDHLFAGRVARGPRLGWLVDAMTAGSGNRLTGLLRALLAPMVPGLLRAGYGWRLEHGRRYRWFAGQVSRATGTPARGFLGCAVRLAADGRDRDNADLIRPMLTVALLADLRAAQRRSLVSVARRRRAWPFLVLVPELGTGQAPGRQFLDTYADVLRHGERSPLLVLAGTTAGAPSYACDRWADPADLEDVADWLSQRLDGRDGVGREPLLVRLPGGADDGSARRWLRANRKVPVRRMSRVDHAVPALSVAVVLALVLAAGGFGWRAAAHRPCADVPLIGVERIGITDGSCLLDDHLAAVEREIRAENERVVDQSGVDRPYRTVVFFAPLSVPGNVPGYIGRSSYGQLLGAALAQRDINAQRDDDGTNLPRIRLLIANPGDRFGAGTDRGRQLAQAIAREAQRDRTVSAVVGISQSRQESIDAVQALVPSGLPVVGAAVTGDAMTDASSFYFQVSPQDRDQAAVAAAFAGSRAVIASDTDDTSALTARNAVVIAEAHDPVYSLNLAADFGAAFSRYPGHRVVRWISHEPDRPDPPRSQLPAGYESRNSAQKLAAELCRTVSGSRDIVFFAGRPQRLNGILNEVKATCGSRPLTIVAGSAVTPFVADARTAPRGEGLDKWDFLRLYYLSFNYPTAPKDLTSDSGMAQVRSARAYSAASNDFFARHAGFMAALAAGGDGDPSMEWAADSDAALGYDATTAAARAIAEAYRQEPNHSPRDVVRELGDVSFEGTSGYVSFRNPAGDVVKAPPDKPVFVLRADPAKPAPTLAFFCGRYGGSPADPSVADEIVTSWEGTACPPRSSGPP
jgi:hypothetical protein